MASEQRTLVQLKHIKAIEFECETCHTRVSYAVEKYDHPWLQCNTCSKSFIQPDSREFSEWATFGRLLKKLSQTPPGLTVRLEVPSTRPA